MPCDAKPRAMRSARRAQQRAAPHGDLDQRRLASRAGAPRRRLDQLGDEAGSPDRVAERRSAATQ
jgi:hypothetical protein